MGRMNTKSRTVTRPRTVGPTSPLRSAPRPGTRPGQLGGGAVSDERTEAFRLGVNLLAGEDSFYEKGNARDGRFNRLMRNIAVEDPSWVAGFLPWLRGTGNIRTASIMGAANAVHARLDNPHAIAEDERLSSLGYKGVNRYIVDQVCQRADEPGEFVAYWKATFGNLPKPVKRGLSDAANRLYNPYTELKYDTDSNAVRFADVLNLTHATPEPGNEQLFRYIIDRRFGNSYELYGLEMIEANKNLRSAVADGNYDVLMDPEFLKAAGLTWEDVLSLGGSHVNKRQLWESLIDAGSLGIMALIRNLRNMEEAGISRAHMAKVTEMIRNPQVIARSRQFPYRFLSAYENTTNLQFRAALEEAVEYSTANIPEFYGKNLVLIDTSGSMTAPLSPKSKQTRSGSAALFGSALAHKSQGSTRMVMFATTWKEVNYNIGGSIFGTVDEIHRRTNEVGWSTNTQEAIRGSYRGEDRIFVFTDMQSNGVLSGRDLGSMVPAETNVYAFDLSGHRTIDMATGSNRRHQLAGLSDATFKMIPLLEHAANATWPWEEK